MPHVRLLRHYFHTTYLVMALVEAAFLAACVYFAVWVRGWGPPFDLDVAIQATIYATLGLVGMVSMGAYEPRLSEGLTGTMLRIAVAVFLVTNVLVGAFLLAVPPVSFGRGVLFVSGVSAFVVIAGFRWCTAKLVDGEALKRRVLVLGTGERALNIAASIRRQSDQHAFRIVEYVRTSDTLDLVTSNGAAVIESRGSLADICKHDNIQEIVVAVDERRRTSNGEGGLPIDELVECRLLGVFISDVQTFVERETGKIDVDLLQPSWLVFNEGLMTRSLRSLTKRAFDLIVSSILLLVTWPIILLAALAIWIESGFRGPVLYWQKRVGLDNRIFSVTKFRSMCPDAEDDGQAVWAAVDDERITRVGAFLRASRIDELPQIFSIFKGDMSFVGPRPERPEFVDELANAIDYYSHRHRVKPGLTGWAQLCYPYGASVEDAKRKLEYDLYYLKNHSLLLDLIILIQTVEVVLVGEGAR